MIDINHDLQCMADDAARYAAMIDAMDADTVSPDDIDAARRSVDTAVADLVSDVTKLVTNETGCTAAELAGLIDAVDLSMIELSDVVNQLIATIDR